MPERGRGRSAAGRPRGRGVGKSARRPSSLPVLAGRLHAPQIPHTSVLGPSVGREREVASDAGGSQYGMQTPFASAPGTSAGSEREMASVVGGNGTGGVGAASDRLMGPFGAGPSWGLNPWGSGWGIPPWMMGGPPAGSSLPWGSVQGVGRHPRQSQGWADGIWSHEGLGVRESGGVSVAAPLSGFSLQVPIASVDSHSSQRLECARAVPGESPGVMAQHGSGVAVAGDAREPSAERAVAADGAVDPLAGVRDPPLHAAVSRACSVWIVGHSFIHRAGERALIRPGGRHLGLEHRGVRVSWWGQRGMRWHQLLPLMARQRSNPRRPDLLLVHLGGNDVDVMTVKQLIDRIKDDLRCVLDWFPHLRLVWSDIIPRLRRLESRRWTRGLIKINRQVAKWVEGMGGLQIQHSWVDLTCEGLYARDRVHLSAVGCDLLLDDFATCCESHLVATDV
uniref:Uncharacterized protein LOC117357060 n=1 Tax=Geotrypetes seraphini TaxID=260995 RepID=A0A6P8QZM8_GEOSA|nr:uncharacterized protein LOC117357060 [Geotrypetes seraphini]